MAEELIWALTQLNGLELTRKINALELKYDESFSVVFQALKELIDQPKPARRQIGFVKR